MVFRYPLQQLLFGVPMEFCLRVLDKTGKALCHIAAPFRQPFPFQLPRLLVMEPPVRALQVAEGFVVFQVIQNLGLRGG